MKKWIKMAAAGLVVILFAPFWGSCSGESETAATPRPAENTAVRIGFSMDSFVVERWQRDRDAFLAAAGQAGVQVLLRTANEDIIVQRRQLLELSNSNIDVLVVVPNDSEELTDTIASIRDRGIPVLAYDRLIRNTVIDGYISFDNHAIGAVMADAVARAATERAAEQGYESTRVLVVNGAVTDYNSFMLNRGIVTSLRPLIERGRIKLLDSLWLQQWRNEEARRVIADAFQEHGRIDGVVAANDLIADEVVHYAAERGLAGTVAVSGMDGDLAAVQRVAEGTQLMTVYKPVEQLAEQALDAALQLARGERLAEDETIFNGSAEIAFIKLPAVLVTQDTILETVIADGFHSYESVYQNIPEQRRPPRP